jgi:transcriptional regulator with XRE-family HTH domain
MRNKPYRDKFVAAHLSINIVAQMQTLREARGWSQKELADRAKMSPSRISVMEDPSYDKFTLSTLKRLASALDVALVTRFTTFSDLVNWVSNLSPEKLEVLSFGDDKIADAAMVVERAPEIARKARIHSSGPGNPASSGFPDDNAQPQAEPSATPGALLPCPFCGNVTPTIRSNNIGDYYVLCETEHEGEMACGLQWRDALATEQTMHAAWRKRAEQAEAELGRLTRELAEAKAVITRLVRVGNDQDIRTRRYEDVAANAIADRDNAITRAEAAEAKCAGMAEALKEMVYETTHLSPPEDDGAHKCRISAAALSRAREALKQWGEVITRSSASDKAES